MHKAKFFAFTLAIYAFLGSALILFTPNASAAHFTVNECINSDDEEYIHVHWFRDDNTPDPHIAYDVTVLDEGGEPSGTYNSVIVGEATDWNNAQDFVTLDLFGTTLITVTVDDFGFTGGVTGQTSSNPSICTTSTSHLFSASIQLDSDNIEAVGSGDDSLREWTAGHEWGHAIGLHHDDDDNTRLMYWGWVSGVAADEPQTGDIDVLDGQFDPYGHVHEGTR